MAVNFCPKCGGKLPENAKFCGKCGAPIPQAPVVQPEPVAAVEPEPIVPVQPEPIVAVKPEPITPVQSEPFAAVEPEPIVPVQPEPVAAVKPELIAPAQPEPKPAAPVQPKPAPVRTAAPVAVEEPVPQLAKSETPSKKDPLPRRGAGRTILAVLLCTLIFIWSFFTIVLSEVRVATSGSTLTNSLSSAMKDIDLKDISASTLIAGETDPDKTLSDWVVDQIEANYNGRIEVSDTDLDAFIDQSTVGPFLYEKLGAYTHDIYTGSSESGVTAQELEVLLKENAPLIEEVFDLELSDAEIRKIAATAEEAGTLNYLSAEALKQEAAPVYYAAQIGLSWWVIGFAVCQVLLFVLLLALVNKQALRTCGDVGITLTVASGILVLAGLASKILPVFSAELGTFGTVAGILLFGGILPALAALGAGIVLILVMVIGKAIRAKAAAKKKS